MVLWKSTCPEPFADMRSDRSCPTFDRALCACGLHRSHLFYKLTPMFTRFAFMLLLCALVVPKVAWGAHLGGHEQLATAGAVHTHHAQHVHEDDGNATADAGPEAGVVSDKASSSGGEKGLTHDHGPSLTLTAGVLLPQAPELSAWRVADRPIMGRSLPVDALSRPDSLLRPPRAAV